MKVKKPTLISRTKAMLRAGKSIPEMAAALQLPLSRVYTLRSKARAAIAKQNFKTSQKMRLRGVQQGIQTAQQTSPKVVFTQESVKPATPNDLQVGGNHYRKHKIQPWDAIHAWGLGFFTGNAVKYIARHKDKGGLEDIKKARHYLDKLIAMNGDDRGSMV